ncbi:MAG TPA: tetratricopeptide repeat protein [Rhizomicrobium sp.]
MIWNRRRADALLKEAQTALRDKHWNDAERLWREYGRLQPKDVRALTGLASTLIGLERLPEAAAAGETLSRNFPRHTEGPSVLARVAVQQQRWVDAEHHWRAVLTRQENDRNGLAGVARALIKLGRLAEAETALEKLREAWPTLNLPYLVASELAEARGDVEAAVEASRKTVALFPDNKQALRDLGFNLLKARKLAEAEQIAEQLLVADPYAGDILKGQLLVQREPDADHTDFWKAALARHPSSTEILRRVLHAALGAGRKDDAVAALDELLAHHLPRLSDANYLIGVANLLNAKDTEQKDTRRFVRTYLRRMRDRPEYRRALLRLSRLLAAQFAPPRWRHRCFPALLQKADLQEETRALLDRVQAVETRLARAPSFLDSDLSPDVCRNFIRTVHEHLYRQEPFSFVRLGDGEANCLLYENASRSYAASDAAEREVVWWGAPVPAEKRAELAVRVLSATRRADCIGIPGAARFLRDTPLERDDALLATRSGRGLRAVLSAVESGYLSDASTPPARTYASAHLHQDIAFWKLYGELFDHVGDVVCVTCHPDLPDALRSRFGVKTAANFVIAPRSATARLMRKRTADPRTLPEMVRDVLASIGDAPRGRLVIVGAGYLGKWICDEARARGGVALDLGSIVDYWVGLKTRSYLDLV